MSDSPSACQASAKPVCSLKMQQYEEISQEEYEELLRAAGKLTCRRPPKAKPAAPAAPANPFGGAQQAPKQEVRAKGGEKMRMRSFDGIRSSRSSRLTT
eukprot:764861-Hanusia_phi.AAC.3